MCVYTDKYKGINDAYLCEEPKGDHYFYLIVVQETYGLIHIESIKCGKVQSSPNILYSNQIDLHMWSGYHRQVQVHGQQFFLD